MQCITTKANKLASISRRNENQKQRVKPKSKTPDVWIVPNAQRVEDQRKKKTRSGRKRNKLKQTWPIVVLLFVTLGPSGSSFRSITPVPQTCIKPLDLYHVQMIREKASFEGQCVSNRWFARVRSIGWLLPPRSSIGLQLAQPPMPQWLERIAFTFSPPLKILIDETFPWK